MITDSKGRQVMEVEVYGKYDDDIQVMSAIYADTGDTVPDDELDYIAEWHADSIYEIWLNQHSGLDYEPCDHEGVYICCKCTH
jgi:hypothetical protein